MKAVSSTDTPTKLSGKRPINVFYSYSHKDEAFRAELEKHLSMMRRSGEIAEWHDRKIGAGSVWKDSIDQNLENADLILLLVSSDFLGSNYCYDNEMKRAMERHQEGSARVIPIILRPCDWSKTPFAELQALPKDGIPLTSWSNRDEGYHNIVLGIQQAAAQFVSSRPRHRAVGARKLALIGLYLLLIVGLVFTGYKLYLLNTGETSSQSGEAHPPGPQPETIVPTPERILVTGFVFDSMGNGIDSVQVRVENAPTVSPESTASSGKFILKDVPGKPGDFIWLVFSKEGYKEERHEFQINGLQKTITLEKK